MLIIHSLDTSEKRLVRNRQASGTLSRTKATTTVTLRFKLSSASRCSTRYSTRPVSAKNLRSVFIYSNPSRTTYAAWEKHPLSRCVPCGTINTRTHTEECQGARSKGLTRDLAAMHSRAYMTKRSAINCTCASSSWKARASASVSEEHISAISCGNTLSVRPSVCKMASAVA